VSVAVTGLVIRDSILRKNPSLGFEKYPGIYFHASGEPHSGDQLM